jgi:ArsR family transcriptional regulator
VDDTMTSSVAKALGHPARLHILRLLAAQTECRGADVFSELPLAQSTISEHLRVLKDAGLVSARPEGNGMVYCVGPRALDEFIAALSSLTSMRASCASTGKGC